MQNSKTQITPLNLTRDPEGVEILIFPQEREILIKFLDALRVSILRRNKITNSYYFWIGKVHIQCFSQW
jgi:hypothetical protein